MKVRSGYTLLEVILAIGIGLLLVAALYVALDVQFRYMQSGRDAVAEGQLARGLLARIAADIRLSMAMLPTTGGEESTATASTGGSSAGAEADDTESIGTGRFNYGIVGDEQVMTLFLSTVPRYGLMDADLPIGVSDLRRVTYYLSAEQGLTGLARQDVRRVTAEDPESEEPPDILAEEVVDLRFSYYDAGTGQWMPTWDGTQQGPPLAVEIQLGIEPPGETGVSSRASRGIVYYRLVVAIPTANMSQELVNQQAGSP